MNKQNCGSFGKFGLFMDCQQCDDYEMCAEIAEKALGLSSGYYWEG